MGMDQVITVQRSVDTEEMYKLIGMENLWNLGHRFASVEVTVSGLKQTATWMMLVTVTYHGRS